MEHLKTALWAPGQKHFLPLSLFDGPSQAVSGKEISSAVTVYRGKGAAAVSRVRDFSVLQPPSLLITSMTAPPPLNEMN